MDSPSSDRPGAGQSSPNPGDDRALVEVYSTESESEAMVIQGLLDSAGIETIMTSDIGAKDVLPIGSTILKVAADNADEARRIIEDYHSNPPDIEMITDDSEP